MKRSRQSEASGLGAGSQEEHVSRSESGTLFCHLLAMYVPSDKSLDLM